MPSQETMDKLLAEKLQLEEDSLSADLVTQRMKISYEDELLAKKLQEEEAEEYRNLSETQTSSETDSGKISEYKSKFEKHKSISLVDPEWETLDPTPDIFALFRAFDDKFFWGQLKSCEVKWSPRMTVCAGICCYQFRSGFCSIRLSKPLLTLRPRSDLVETLLHEMIHAFLFITQSSQDRDGHGPDFHSHMYRINKEAGTKISVYHSFHDEVRHFKVHHWRCDGPCRDRRPFYGWVKRSMNRAPSKNDMWWADHQRTCGGNFIKVSEPAKKIKEPSASQKRKSSPNNTERKTSPLRKYLKKDPSQILSQPGPSGSSVSDPDRSHGGKSFKTPSPPGRTSFIPFQGKGHTLGGATKKKLKQPTLDETLNRKNQKEKRINKLLDAFSSSDDEGPPPLIKKETSGRSKPHVSCPVCQALIEESQINAHLDTCLS